MKKISYQLVVTLNQISEQTKQLERDAKTYNQRSEGNISQNHERFSFVFSTIKIPRFPFRPYDSYGHTTSSAQRVTSHSTVSQGQLETRLGEREIQDFFFFFFLPNIVPMLFYTFS